MSLLSPKSPVYYLPKGDFFGWKRRFRGVNPVYMQCCRFFGAQLIDRTETLDVGIPFGIIDPMPKSTEQVKSFDTLCLERAERIIQTNARYFKVLWSGGIDSTVALIALLKVVEEQNCKERIKILLSQESVVEFPRFYTEIIEGKYPVEWIETGVANHIQPHEVIVTGENGDQLFGSDKLKFPVLTGDAFQPYEDILDFLIERKLGTDKYTQRIMDLLAPQVAQSPVPIKSLYDYLWWMNFSMKWQAVSMRLPHVIGRSHLDLERNVFHFFKDESFERWSLANPQLKIKKDWKSYKFEAKKFIHAFFPDEDYRLNKEKEPSLKEVMMSPAPSWFKRRVNALS